MSRSLGEAFVTMSPDGTGFRAKAYGQIKKALAGIDPAISIKVDTARLDAAFASASAKLATLKSQASKLRLDADAKAATAKIAALELQAERLRDAMGTMTAGVEIHAAATKILALQAEILALKEDAASIRVSANTAALRAALAVAKDEVNRLAAERVRLGVDTAPFKAGIAELQARMTALSDRLTAIPIGVDDTEGLARIANLQVKLLALVHTVADVKIGADTSGILKAGAALAALEAATGKLSASSAKAVDAFLAEQAALAGTTVAQNLLSIAMGKTPPLVAKGNNAMRAFGVTGGWLGGIIGVLGTKITLFGGALQGILPTWATHISVMHLAADILVELIAVWAGAAIAAGAFGVAASDATKEVIQRMQALHLAADATNMSMFPLTGTLEKLHNAVRPEVYQIFGDALVIAKAHTGEFKKIVEQTGPVVDQLAGRMTAALAGGHTFDIFTKNAKNSLLGLGTAFGNVFGAIGNILNVVPDYAQKLLSFGVVVTRLLENFTAMIAPVLHWGLVIHGAFIYLGLAATLAVALYSKGLVPLALGFYKAAQSAAIYVAGLVAVAVGETGVITTTGLLDAALVALGDVPVLVWVALVGAGIAALILAFHGGSNAADDFTASIEKALGQASLGQTLNVLAQSIAATKVQFAQAQAQARMYGDAAVHAAGQTVNAGKAGTIASTQLLALRDAYSKATAQAQAYAGEITKLQGQQQTFNSHVAAIAKITGSASSAIGALTAAGITQNQMLDTNIADWAATQAQVEGTLAIYQAMTGVAGQLNNDLDVIGRTATDQYQAVQKLNDAWNSFISDVTSTQGSFDTVAQGFEVLASHSGDLKLSLGKLKATFSDTAGSIALQGKLATATAAVASAQASLARLQKSGTGTALQLRAAQDRLTGAQDRLTVAQLNLSAAQSGGIAAIDALTPAGIALNQAFTDQVGNVNKLFAAWRTAGLSNNLFVQGVKDGIAPLVKYATGSQEATAQLIALAQEAGYHGPNSMKELTKWLGNTKNATKDLKDITNQATVQEALLTGAMQSQGDFIANQLIGDINTAILAYSGVQKTATAYGTAVAQFGKGSIQANTAQLALVKGIVAAGVASNDTKDQIAAMIAKILGISSTDAKALIDQVGSSLRVTGQEAKAAADLIDKSYVKSLKAIGFASPSINKDITTFSDQILASGTSSDKTANARKKLIADLIASGVEANTAKNLVHSLQGEIDSLHGKTVSVAFFGSGAGKITFAEQNIKNAQTGFLEFHARGGRVGGSGSGDTVPAMLTPGEVVIPRGMVAAGMVDHLRGMLPGFAAGGLVGPFGILSGVAQDFMGTQMQNAGHAAEQSAIDAMVADMKAKVAAAAAAAAAAAGFTPGAPATGSALAAQQFAQSILPAGWSWPALLSLWNQESGWNAWAVNPSSGAYGIPQSLGHGHPYNLGDYANQVRWGISYIAGRYGDSQNAWAHEMAFNWYGKGGLVPTAGIYDGGGVLPAHSWGYNAGSRPEMVTPAAGPGSLAETNARLARLSHQLDQLTRVTAAQGAAFAHGIGVATSRGSIRGYYG